MLRDWDFRIQFRGLCTSFLRQFRSSRKTFRAEFLRFAQFARNPSRAYRSFEVVSLHYVSSQVCDETNKGKHIMKTTQFTGMLSSTERTLTAAIAVTLSFATTTVIATAFQGAAAADSLALLAMLSKVFA
jgi:hypothetical protein